MSRALPWTGISTRIKGLTRPSPRNGSSEETSLYYRRACLAAAEERYDSGLIFCAKALAIDPRHLPTRLLIARIYDRGLHDVNAAIAGYRKVIALASYDSQDPYCAAAQAALDTLVSTAR